MTECKWTPGPWSWDENARRYVRAWLWSDAGAVVDYAGCGSHDTNVSDADRNLIAAATDLYDALAQFVDAVDSDVIRVRPSDRDILMTVLSGANTALAKARGE